MTDQGLFKASPPANIDAVSKTRAYLQSWDAKHSAYKVPSRRVLTKLLTLGDSGHAIVVINVMDTAKLGMNKELRTWFKRLAVRFHRSNHFSDRVRPVLFASVDTTHFDNPDDRDDNGYSFIERCFKPRLDVREQAVPPYFSNTLYVSSFDGTWYFKTRVEQVGVEKVLDMSVEPVVQKDILDLIARASPDDATVKPYSIADLNVLYKHQGIRDLIKTSVTDLDTLVEASHEFEKDTIEGAGNRFLFQTAALEAVDARYELSRFLPVQIRAVVYVTLKYDAFPAAGLPLFEGLWNPEDLTDAVLRRIITSDVLAAQVLILSTDALDTPNIPAVSGVSLDTGRSYLYGDVALLLDAMDGLEGHGLRRRAASHVHDVALTPVKKWTSKLCGKTDPYPDIARIASFIKLQAAAWRSGRRHPEVPARAGKDDRHVLPYSMPGYDRAILSGTPDMQMVFKTKTSSVLAMANLAMMRCKIAAILVDAPSKANTPSNPALHFRAVQATIVYLVTRNLVTDPFRYAFIDKLNMGIAVDANVVEEILTVVCSDPNDLQAFYQIYGRAQILAENDVLDTSGLDTGERDHNGHLTDVIPQQEDATHAQATARVEGHDVAGSDGWGLGSGTGMEVDMKFDLSRFQHGTARSSWLPLRSGVKELSSLPNSHLIGDIKRLSGKTIRATQYVPSSAWKSRPHDALQPPQLPSFCVNERSKMAYTFGANLTDNHAYPCVYLAERRVANTKINMACSWTSLEEVVLPLFFAVTRYETLLKPTYDDRNRLAAFYAIAGPGPRIVDVLLAVRPPQLTLSRAQRRLFNARYDANEQAFVLTNARRIFEEWRAVIASYNEKNDHSSRSKPVELILAARANAALPSEFVKLALNKGHYQSRPHFGGRAAAAAVVTTPMLSPKPAAAAAAKELPFTVYGATWCGYTQKALAAIGSKNCAFVEVGSASEARALASSTHAFPDTHKTLPVVFEHDKFIGGATETLARLKELKDERLKDEVVKDPLQWKLAAPRQPL